MTGSPARGTWRLRSSWALRFTLGSLRRRHWAAAMGAAAFALAALGLVAMAACAGGVPPRAEGSGSAGGGAGRAELIAFLQDDLPVSARDRLVDALRGLPGIGAVRLRGGDEALAELRADLGSRAGILDGVEDGFLPATVEVTLEPEADPPLGRVGMSRAESLAWRLRRMDGILDVDVVGLGHLTASGPAGAPSRGVPGPLGAGLGLAMGASTLVLAILLAVAALRPRRGEAQLLMSLGFTRTAVALPTALAGVILAACGIVLAVALVAAAAGGTGLVGLPRVSRIFEGSNPGRLPAWIAGAYSGPAFTWGAALSSAGRWAASGVLAMGAVIGWWVGRAGTRQVEELALE